MKKINLGSLPSHMIMKNAINLIKKFIPGSFLPLCRNIKYNLLDGYATKSYSQEGEDLILKRIFEGKEKGFYVDVGAHHPKRFSNSYLFYRMGWRGINIDPNPDAIGLFYKYRPRDINLACGISDVNEQLIYYIFNDPALNSFSRDYVEKLERETDYYVVNQRLINVYGLSTVLAQYMPDNICIDFMSIDTEGLDFNVLKSNDWYKFRPLILLVEEFDFSFERSSIYNYLTEQEYTFLAKTLNTLLFKDKRQELRLWK